VLYIVLAAAILVMGFVAVRLLRLLTRAAR
jgi:hypothetical protein